MLTRPGRVAVRAALAAAAVGAGLIHLACAPEHLAEYLPLGVGFVTAGVLQLAWAVAVSVSDSPRLLRAGAAASALFVAVYVLSRTAGLPLGPEAFEPEPVGAVDLLCCVLELAAAGAALLLTAAAAPRRAGQPA